MDNKVKKKEKNISYPGISFFYDKLYIKRRRFTFKIQNKKVFFYEVTKYEVIKTQLGIK